MENEFFLYTTYPQNYKIYIRIIPLNFKILSTKKGILMVKKIAKYKVKQGSEEIVEEAAANIVSKVQSHEGLTRYTVYRTNEERTYVHIMSFPDEDAAAKHRDSEYNQEFMTILRENCDEEPSYWDLEKIENA